MPQAKKSLHKEKQKTDHTLEYTEQLGWNCFDLAVELGKSGGRTALIEYALQHSSEQEFRNLLAPEIRQAAVLTAVYMNQKTENTHKKNEFLTVFFKIIETSIHEKIDQYQLESYANFFLDQIEEDGLTDLPRNALPPSMHTEELQRLVNHYINAHENMREIGSKCNDALAISEGCRWPLEKLDIFFSVLENQHEYPELFTEFQSARQELFTPHEQAFDEYCNRQFIYEQYVRDYYGNCGWFAFQRNFQGEYSTSMVDIAAKFMHVTFVIQQDNADIYRTKFQEDRVVKVEYNGVNHFSRSREKSGVKFINSDLPAVPPAPKMQDLTLEKRPAHCLSIPVVIPTLFDQERISVIWKEYTQAKNFSLPNLKELRRLSRKYGLTSVIFAEILCALKDITDLQQKLIISQILKYACRNRAKIPIEELLILLESNDDSSVKSEIIMALGYTLQNLRQEYGSISQEAVGKIRQNVDIVEGIHPDIQSFLDAELKKHYDAMSKKSIHTISRKPKKLKHTTWKKSSTTVSKTQQTVKTSYKKSQSEEATVNLQNIADALREKRKTTTAHAQTTSPKTDKKRRSSNLPWFPWLRSAHTSVKALYGATVIQKQPVTDSDKQYLRNIFIAEKGKFSGGIIGELLTDRMIANIFATISDPDIPESQDLEHEAAGIIAKLMQCLGNIEEVRQKIAKDVSPRKITSGTVERAKEAVQHLAVVDQAIKHVEGYISPDSTFICHAHGLIEYLGETWIPSDPNDIERPITEKISTLQKELGIALRDRSIDKIDEKMQQIRQAIYVEIDSLRIDAITAIYHSFLRNTAILENPGYIEIIKSCLDDPSKKLKEFAVKILRSTNNLDLDTSQRCLQSCVEMLENAENVEVSCDYIFQQVGNSEQCKKLFSPEIVLRLSAVLTKFPFGSDQQNDAFGNKIKFRCCSIVHKYLETNSYESLDSAQSDTLVKNLANIITNQHANQALKEKTFNIILLIAIKRQYVPQSVIDKIIANIHQFNSSNLTNFALIVLDAVCENEQLTIKEVGNLSHKLLDSQVIVAGDNKIIFENQTSENVGYRPLSALASRVLACSLEKGIIVQEQCLRDLIQGLGSHDKQTKIWSAKALFFASKHHSFPNDIIVDLMEYVLDEAFDVSVYASLAYTYGLKEFYSSSENAITISHLETLSKIYAVDDLMLNDDNLAQRINSNILDILQNEAGRQIFDEDLFGVLEHVLLVDTSLQEKAIAILDSYTKTEKELPISTVNALESLIGSSDASDKALNVLKNIIRNGRAVSEKTLQVLVDKLYFEDKDQLRSEAFELLRIANDNQDLSDNIFNILELERAAHTIANWPLYKPAAFFDLEQATANGQNLTIDAFNALKDELNHIETLKILYHASKNKQIIPKILLTELEIQFNPIEPIKKQKLLIDILLNVVQNNQSLSLDLEKKLSEALNNEQISDKVLLIFALKAQKGEQLIPPGPERILIGFSAAKDSTVRQECLHAICAILLQHNANLDMHLAKQALIKGLTLDNDELVSECISAFAVTEELSTDDISISELIKTAAHINCKPKIKAKILQLLSTKKLNEQQQAQILLIKLTQDEFLTPITWKLTETYSEPMNLMPGIFYLVVNHNEQQLTITYQGIGDEQVSLTIIEPYFKLLLTGKDTAMLNYPRSKALISSYLQDIIQTTQEEILNELLKLSKSVELLPKNFEQICYAIDNLPRLQEKALNILLQCLNKSSIPDVLVDSIILLRESTTSQTNRDACDIVLKQLAEMEISSKLKLEAFLTKLPSDSTIANHSIFSRLCDCFASLVGTKLDLKPQSSIEETLVVTLKTEISQQKLIISTLNSYIENLPTISPIYAQEIAEKLSDLLLSQTQSEEMNTAIFSCLSKTAGLVQLLSNAQSVLDEGLNNDDLQIRILAFRGLRAAKTKNYSSEKFDIWCEEAFHNIEREIERELLRDLDLLDTLISLVYVDLSAFEEKDQYSIERSLLLLDLLEEGDSAERLNFYAKWSLLEKILQKETQALDTKEIKKILKFLKLLHDIQIKHEYSFYKLQEILIFSTALGLSRSSNILASSINVYEDLKSVWIMNLIKTKLSNPANDSYIQQLATLITNLSVCLIEKIFNVIITIESLKEFESLIKFIEDYKFSAADIDQEITTVLDLRKILETNYLIRKIHGKSNRVRIQPILENLLEKKWPFAQFEELFNQISEFNYASEEARLVQVLETLDQYNLVYEEHKTLLTPLNLLKDEKCVTYINEIAIKTVFQNVGKIKNVNELIIELKDENPEFKGLANLMPELAKIKNPELQVRFNAILSVTSTAELSGDEIAQIYVLKNPISEWSESTITLWARIVKNNPAYSKQPEFLSEALAVTKRANFLATGFQLADAQILSCIILLTKPEDKGRLLQVATGEGKSTIICMCAIVQALKGKKVDIITSSPVLAERDVKDKGRIYKIFGLLCAHNNDSDIYVKGPKDCYKKDIVYGEVSQFQFDTLRDQYSLLGTMASRKSAAVIVDEVDSMLIDDSSKIARLSSTVAGMDLLQPLYHFIWQRLISIQSVGSRSIDGKDYCFYGIVKYDSTGEPSIGYIDTKGNIINLSDIKPSEIISLGHFNYTDKEEFSRAYLDFIEKHLTAYVSSLIGKQVKIPPNLLEFVNTQIPKWVNSAINARFHYARDKHYIVDHGEIKPIDGGTGVIQGSTSWGNGLHQFLQIKEELKLTSETLTTNFLSNRGYFKLYGHNLLGLSGTLGSYTARQSLKDVYQVDLINIPRSRKKQHLKLPTVISSNKEKWLAEIYRSAKNEANKGRGVLIICKTIKEAQKIETALKSDQYTVKLYTRNDAGQEHAIEKIAPREIIVATNLAGRGTDIQTSEIENQGGMHVIVTFLPENQRIEEQAFGRTSRQGKRGTSQMIVRGDLYSTKNMQQLTQIRDIAEADSLERFRRTELKVIETKDTLFIEFCKLMVEIRHKIQEEYGWYHTAQEGYAHVKDVVKSYMRIETVSRDMSVYEKSVLASIEERWAMFLRSLDFGIVSPEDAPKVYQVFSDKIKQDYPKKIIQNPWHHIAIAYDMLRKDSVLSGQYDIALSHFSEAARLAPEHSAAAFIGRGWLLLKGKAGFVWNSQSVSYKQDALETFNQGLKLLSDEIALLTALQANLPHLGIDTTSALCKQLIQKITVLGSYLNSVQSVISTVQASRRLIDLKGTNIDSQATDTWQKSVFVASDCERNEKKAVAIDLHAYTSWDVAFNSLTAMSDCITSDQAINTINSVIYETSSAIEQSYHGISINLLQFSFKQLKTMLNPDIRMQELGKEDAIKLLVNRDSFWSRNFFPARFQDNCMIDLEILFTDKTAQIYKELPRKKAIELIEQQTEKDIYFNLTLIKVNEFAKFFKNKIQPSASLCLEFRRLNQVEATKKITQIKAQHITLEILASKTEIIALIDSLDDQVQVQLFDPQTNLWQAFFKNVALLEVKLSTAEALTIKVEHASYPMTENLISAEKIISLISHAEFSLKFIHTTTEFNLHDDSDEPVNVSFSELTREQAIELIPKIRQENTDFNLEFRNLTAEQTKQVIAKADLEQKDIQIGKKTKTLGDLFTSDLRPTAELQELSARGIEYLLEVNENKFIPWRSMLVLGTIAGVQMAVGAALVSTGFGANSGLGVMTEGAADFVNAARILFSREFSWSNYAQQKAISIAISATCMGFQKLKDIGKGLKEVGIGAQKVSAAVVEEGGQQLMTQSLYKLAKKSLANLQIKSMRSLVVKETGVLVAESVGRELSNKIIDVVTDFCFDQYRPQISANIERMVCNKFSNSLGFMVRKMYALDKINGSQMNQTKINTILADILNPEHCFMRKKWDSVISPILKGVLADDKYLGSKFTLALRLWGTIHGSYELVTMIDYLHSELLKHFIRLENETLSIANLLIRRCNLKREQIGRLLQLLQKHNVLDENGQLKNDIDVVVSLNSVDFDEYSTYKEQMIGFLDLLVREMSKVELADLSMIIKSIADVITNQMIGTIESQLISPWSSYAAGSMVSKVSAWAQDRFLVANDQFADNDPELARRKSAEEAKKQVGESPEKKKNTTIRDQIEGNVKSATVALSQITMITKATAKSREKPAQPSKQVQEYARKIQGTEPADLAIMCAMSEANNIKIKITEDPCYELSPEEKAQGVQLVQFIQGKDPNDIGHYQLIDHEGHLVKIPSEDLNCGYAIFASMTGKPVEQLRNEMAQVVLERSANFEHVLEAEHWLKIHYPDEANRLVLRGGADESALLSLGLNLGDRYIKPNTNKSDNINLEALMDTVLGQSIDLITDKLLSFSEMDTCFTTAEILGDFFNAASENCLNRAEKLDDSKPGERIVKQELQQTGKTMLILSQGLKSPAEYKQCVSELTVRSILAVTEKFKQVCMTSGAIRENTRGRDEQYRQEAAKITKTFFKDTIGCITQVIRVSGETQTKYDQADAQAERDGLKECAKIAKTSFDTIWEKLGNWSSGAKETVTQKLENIQKLQENTSDTTGPSDKSKSVDKTKSESSQDSEKLNKNANTSAALPKSAEQNASIFASNGASFFADKSGDSEFHVEQREPEIPEHAKPKIDIGLSADGSATEFRANVGGAALIGSVGLAGVGVTASASIEAVTSVMSAAAPYALPIIALGALAISFYKDYQSRWRKASELTPIQLNTIFQALEKTQDIVLQEDQRSYLEAKLQQLHTLDFNIKVNDPNRKYRRKGLVRVIFGTNLFFNGKKDAERTTKKNKQAYTRLEEELNRYVGNNHKPTASRISKPT